MIIEDLGLIEYETAWKLQKEEVARLKDGSEDKLLLCEHPHVYTLGKSADPRNLLIQPAFLERIGAKSFEIERGGDITYHGPGQLVGYPILDLNRLSMGVRTYVHTLEESLIRTLEFFEVHTERIEGLTGIWLKEGPARKIAAIGIKVSRGITMHGFALNVHTDLSYFNHIVPCGIVDKGVTTLSKEIDREVSLEEVKEQYEKEFRSAFGFSSDPS
ncbi:MAG: lipoyl(octanoyl) transferase LipB [Flavobacteriales bacterium]|nr:lipoyl(octanoyl) transferase LipB [Flavobacteriales bacterium]